MLKPQTRPTSPGCPANPVWPPRAILGQPAPEAWGQATAVLPPASPPRGGGGLMKATWLLQRTGPKARGWGGRRGHFKVQQDVEGGNNRPCPLARSPASASGGAWAGRGGPPALPAAFPRIVPAPLPGILRGRRGGEGWRARGQNGTLRPVPTRRPRRPRRERLARVCTATAGPAARSACVGKAPQGPGRSCRAGRGRVSQGLTGLLHLLSCLGPAVAPTDRSLLHGESVRKYTGWSCRTKEALDSK